jgi:hypothetical protein
LCVTLPVIHTSKSAWSTLGDRGNDLTITGLEIQKREASLDGKYVSTVGPRCERAQWLADVDDLVTSRIGIESVKKTGSDVCPVQSSVRLVP